MRERVERSRIQTNILLAVVSVLLIVPAAALAAADYPSQPIEFVTHNAPGGSNDIMARTLSDINKELKILGQPLVVVNKPGGGGVTARSYVAERAGNSHLILMSGSSGYITSMLLLKDKLAYNYKSFVPIANLAIDGGALMVRSDSPLKTPNDLIAEAKKKPKALTQGGGSFGSNDTLNGNRIQTLKGVQWKFVSFKGQDPEALLNLLSGNVDFCISSIGDVRDHIVAGKLRALFVTAQKRYPYPELKDVPTMAEAGLGEPMMSYRGIMGPPKMSPQAVKVLEAAFKKFMEHDKFKKLIDTNAMLPHYLSSAEYGKLLDKLNETAIVELTELGLLKK